jgi:hypothetical protein
LSATRAERVAHGAHAQHDVQVVTHPRDEEGEDFLAAADASQLMKFNAFDSFDWLRAELRCGDERDGTTTERSVVCLLQVTGRSGVHTEALLRYALSTS